jgi:hypothetical protein
VFVPDLEKLAKHKERELAHYKAIGVRDDETYINFMRRQITKLKNNITVMYEEQVGADI